MFFYGFNKFSRIFFCSFSLIDILLFTFPSGCFLSFYGLLFLIIFIFFFLFLLFLSLSLCCPFHRVLLLNLFIILLLFILDVVFPSVFTFSFMTIGGFNFPIVLEFPLPFGPATPSPPLIMLTHSVTHTDFGFSGKCRPHLGVIYNFCFTFNCGLSDFPFLLVFFLVLAFEGKSLVVIFISANHL